VEKKKKTFPSIRGEESFILSGNGWGGGGSRKKKKQLIVLLKEKRKGKNPTIPFFKGKKEKKVRSLSGKVLFTTATGEKKKKGQGKRKEERAKRGGGVILFLFWGTKKTGPGRLFIA